MLLNATCVRRLDLVGQSVITDLLENLSNRCNRSKGGCDKMTSARFLEPNLLRIRLGNIKPGDVDTEWVIR